MEMDRRRPLGFVRTLAKTEYRFLGTWYYAITRYMVAHYLFNNEHEHVLGDSFKNCKRGEALLIV